MAPTACLMSTGFFCLQLLKILDSLPGPGLSGQRRQWLRSQGHLLLRIYPLSNYRRLGNEGPKKRAAQWAALLPKSSKAGAYFTIEICCWVYSVPFSTLME